VKKNGSSEQVRKFGHWKGIIKAKSPSLCETITIRLVSLGERHERISQPKDFKLSSK
jgi:hypothetical protein